MPNRPTTTGFRKAISQSRFEHAPRPFAAPGRLDKKLSVGPPDYQARVELLRLYRGGAGGPG